MLALSHPCVYLQSHMPNTPHLSLNLSRPSPSLPPSLSSSSSSWFVSDSDRGIEGHCANDGAEQLAAARREHQAIGRVCNRDLWDRAASAHATAVSNPCSTHSASSLRKRLRCSAVAWRSSSSESSVGMVVVGGHSEPGRVGSVAAPAGISCASALAGDPTVLS